MKLVKYIFLIIIGFSFIQNLEASPLRKAKREKVSAAEDTPRKNGDWFYYIEDAYAASKKTGKPILANFTGSDWCGWCIRLKNEVFSTTEFKTWSDKNVILLELDFPRNKVIAEDLRQQNASLQQFFKVGGYPTLWVFNLDFTEATKLYNIQSLGSIGYVAGGPAEWTKQTDQILKVGK